MNQLREMQERAADFLNDLPRRKNWKPEHIDLREIAGMAYVLGVEINVKLVPLEEAASLRSLKGGSE